MNSESPTPKMAGSKRKADDEEYASVLSSKQEERTPPNKKIALMA